jgi:hypothetical protein
MKRTSIALALSLVLSPLVLARNDGDSTIWVTSLKGAIDSGWVVSVPGGSSDYFNTAHTVLPGLGNSEQLVDGLPITGLAVSVADFGSSGLTFPLVGVYYSNPALDPSGCTPDLTKPISTVANPSFTTPSLFEFVTFDLPEGTIAPGTPAVQAVVQFPPGDSGLLAVGSDSTVSPGGCSSFTQDGYTTPSIEISFLDFGINPGQDNSSTSSCAPSARLPNGRLRVSSRDVGSGDHLTTTVGAGDALTLAFFGNQSGDEFRIVCNDVNCSRVLFEGGRLFALADGDGDGSYLRLNASWPLGHGGSTFQFSAVWGNDACLDPGVGFTNCVTIISKPDPVFGVCDDGTIESGWVAQVPAGSSDYFNNDFGLVPPTVNNVLGLCVSVLDFVTAVPAFPTAGVSDANLTVDPSGHTPDVSGAGVLCLIAPFTFPSGSFETTAGQYTCHLCPMPVPGSSFQSEAHGWVQFPPGDSGLLAVGGDTTASNGCSFFTLDGYTTPAVTFFVNWGIRVLTN